jgi:hypothetical protein
MSDGDQTMVRRQALLVCGQEEWRCDLNEILIEMSGTVAFSGLSLSLYRTTDRLAAHSCGIARPP